MNRTKRAILSLAVVCTLLMNTVCAYAQDAGDAGSPAKIYLPFVAGGSNVVADLIPGQYIVVLKDELVTSASVSAVAADMAATYGGELLQTYDTALNGFAVKFTAEAGENAAAALGQDNRVAYVEPDRVVSIDDENAVDTTQSSATWGLDRIDQHNLPLNAKFNYVATGAGVNVYIIDTGIRIAHTQFGGRASYGYDAVDGSLPADDCNGHGTHVAGTIGSATYGVAKGVKLVAVRVLDCSGSGTNSGVIAGINWVKSQKQAHVSIPAVANMSLGGSFSSALNQAVTSAIQVGVTFAVAAGNSNTNACNSSPASVTSAITVGATQSNDARASFSNYGSCVDIFAPGVNILSTWNTSNTATNTISGTSMATPHVAGVAALYLQTHLNASPSTVDSALKSIATLNKVTSPGAGSPNRLLFTSY
ncbi:MAG: S8 family peptidase [Chloroflexi bacterium]|nr:S8 family peptidase [Chloroflexota bacterium]